MIYRIVDFVRERAMQCAIALFLSVLLCSCPEPFEMDNNGYPEAVTLPGAGGKKIVEGGSEIAYMDVEDAEVTAIGDVDSLYYKTDWLTIKYKCGEKRFECIALPNPGKGQRYVFVGLHFKSEFGTINVVQEGNLEAASNEP